MADFSTTTKEVGNYRHSYVDVYALDSQSKGDSVGVAKLDEYFSEFHRPRTWFCGQEPSTSIVRDWIG
ncbi:hypothetical protein PSHT_03967 [Puccinia striiformis]|uniref:Uncharacterized protein n=1 Tax=Puccinia striiformis TaxID=27350 RepID=A0A2S4WE52_9BASI|nr:hypothetical protein PSHT_03967 [Puccinia striiformis]